MSTPPADPGTALVQELKRLAAAGGHGASLDAVAAVLQLEGLRSASASSLSRLARGRGRPPEGPDEAFRAALRQLGGPAAAEHHVEALVRLRKAAAASAPPPTPRRTIHRTRRYPQVDAADQLVAHRFAVALVGLVARVAGGRPSARFLADEAQIGSDNARAAYDGRVALPADVVDVLLERAVRDGGPRLYSEVAAMARVYVDDIVPLGRPTTASGREAVQRITAYLSLDPPAAQPLVRPDIGRLRKLSRRNLQDADVALAPRRDGGLRLRDIYVDRTVEADEKLACIRPSVAVIVGEPGDGKSSLLWRLASRCQDRGLDPLFLRATDVASLDHAALRAALATPSVAVPVLLVDTVDLLLRSGEVASVLRDLLDIAVAANAAVVLTCRTREAAVLRRIGAGIDPELIKLGPYDAEEMLRAVAAHIRHLTTLPSGDAHRLTDTVLAAIARGLPLKEVCRRPLTLRMLFELELIGGSAWPRSGTAEIDVTVLYAHYWKLRVRDDVRGTHPPGAEVDATAAAEFAAVCMMAAGVPQLEQRDLDHELTSAIAGAAALRTGLVELRRRGVVADHTDGGDVEFFHQTFFEYAAAHALLTLGEDMVDAALARVEAEPNELFFAAVAQQLLVLATSTRLAGTRLDSGLARLLRSDNADVVQMAVAAYAQSRHRGPMAHDAAVALLACAGTGVVRRYLSYLPRVWHADVTVVLRELQTLWDRPDLVTEARVDVIAALRALAAMRPGEVLDALLAGRLDYRAWFATLSTDEARRLRGEPLGLVAELYETDPGWASDRLVELAERVSENGSTQDALADVLGVAASLGADPQRHLRLVPKNLKPDASGIGPMKAALAGLWLRAHDRPAALVSAALEPCHTAADLVRRRAALWALAELLHAGPPDVAASILDEVLAVGDPRFQADAVDHLLRRLVEGSTRPALPGLPPPTDTPVTAWARAHCVAALATLPASTADPSGRRAVSVLWRDAIDHARLPPGEVVTVLDALPIVDHALWTDKKGLAVLVAAAGIGGHTAAAAALRDWSSGTTQSDSTVRKIIASRLIGLAATEPAAIDHLLADATNHQDAAFLADAVLQPGGRPLPDVSERGAPILALARSLLAAPKAAVRRDAYRLLTALGSTTPVPYSLVVDAVRFERASGADNAALRMAEASIDGTWGDYWTGRSVGALDGALADRGRTRTKDTDGCNELRRELLCRSGEISNVGQRKRTTRLVRELVLATPTQASLRPLAHLLQRLADVDRDAACALLVEASRTVHHMPDGSWKARRAHRWRAGMVPILERATPSTWRETMQDLATADPQILIQAIGISVTVRTDNPADAIAALLPPQAAPAVVAELRNARLRRQRVTGGTRTWLLVRDAWSRQHRLS